MTAGAAAEALAAGLPGVVVAAEALEAGLPEVVAAAGDAGVQGGVAAEVLEAGLPEVVAAAEALVARLPGVVVAAGEAGCARQRNAASVAKQVRQCFIRPQIYAIFGAFPQNCLSLHPELRYGVTVALQILVLPVQVRILVPQHKAGQASCCTTVGSKRIPETACGRLRGPGGYATQSPGGAGG